MNNRSLINVQHSDSIVQAKRNEGSRAKRMCYKLTNESRKQLKVFRLVHLIFFLFYLFPKSVIQFGIWFYFLLKRIRTLLHPALDALKIKKMKKKTVSIFIGNAQIANTKWKRKGAKCFLSLLLLFLFSQYF